MTMTRGHPTAISLFSGAGGLDIGVEDAGFEVRCALEINRFAAATLRVNKWLSTASIKEFDAWFDLEGAAPYRTWDLPAVERVRARLRAGVGRHGYLGACEVVEGDIRKVAGDAILRAARLRRGELDILFGGPPCQSFSRAGKRMAIDDERGQLFLEFVRIAADLMPRWILLENVKGLVQTKATVWRSICEECGHASVPPFDPDAEMPDNGESATVCLQCGSTTTHWEVVKAKRGGSLDWIQSAFNHIGYRTAAFLLLAADYGVPQRRERVFIIGSRDNERLHVPRQRFSEDEHRTAWDTLFSEPNPDHRWPLDPKRAVLWVKNVVRPHDEPVTWDLRQPAPTVGAHQGAKFAIAPFGVPEQQLKRQQWHVLGRRQGDTPPVPVEHSYLSDRDLLLLQSFPVSWYVAGTRMDRAFQIGNAVPPLLASAVARALQGDEGGVIVSDSSSNGRVHNLGRLGSGRQITLF